ncbi:MAG TPA: class I SAM-dependent methyltransferase [Candidatus Acidoferrales bacterium]|nr:class I SAM-dependent methyltransferase [Candidatus Acidoferrales bacterium]
MIVKEKIDTEIVLACNVCQSNHIQKVDPDFNFCRCDSCGYVFDSPRPSFAEISAFYSQAGKYDTWLKEERSRDRLWTRRLKKLLESGAKGRLLDIGTGYGQFLHHAQPFFSGVTGTEVSASAIAIAKEKYGLLLLAGQVEDLDLPAESFDIITLFHVLEHVPDPSKLVHRCHALLRAQGTLVIAVPNDVLAWTSKIKKIGKQFGLKRYQQFSAKLGISRAGSSPEIHLSHFTPSVLRRLLENSGLHDIEESLDPYYVSRGIRLFLDSAYYTVHRVLRATMKINRYDTIWMIARKP